MRPDCKLERNLRIYRAHQKGISSATLAKLAGVTPERIRQIVAFTEQQLRNGNINHESLFSDN